ncbi:MAG: tetrahydrofolate synthase [Prevotella salivae]|nr:tetrahydrofolate synthase [Segatella salivae]
MNVFGNRNVLMVQRRRGHTSIPMNVFGNRNALMVQRRRCYSKFSMKLPFITNALTTQLGTSCSFDSPGLARNEPTLGQRSQGDSTP